MTSSIAIRHLTTRPPLPKQCKMLVQYRLPLYSILFDLLNAMQACKVVELFLLATIRLVSLLWWNAILRLIELSISQWIGVTCSRSARTLSSTSRHPLSICVIDFSLSVMQFAPRRSSVCRTPDGFFLNPVSDESLDPDDHTARICFPQLFSMSSSKTNGR